MLTLALTAVIVVVAAGGIACIASPKARTLIKGFGSLFVEDMAKTPRGANAVYNQAIEESEKQYVIAADTYEELVGRLVQLKTEYDQNSLEQTRVEHQCEQLARNGDDESLKIKALQRQSIVRKNESLKEQITKLAPLVEEAKNVHNQWELKVQQLKEEKDTKISEMQLADSMKGVYAKMDNLRAQSGADKLLGAVRDGVDQAKREAVGAQMVHNNKIETKASAIDQKLLEEDNDEYINSLKSKYGRIETKR